MTDETVTPAEPTDQPMTYAGPVAELRRIADALEPLTLPAGEGRPWLEVLLLLDTAAGVDAASAAVVGVVATTKQDGGMWRHRATGKPFFGVGNLTVQATVPGPADERDAELERLRAENSLLRGAAAAGVDASGLLDSPRGDRSVPLIGRVQAEILTGARPVAASETPAHYETRGWKGDTPGSCGVECACGLGYDGFDSLAEAQKLLAVHIAASSPS